MKLTSKLNPEINRKLLDSYFVGRLVTEDDLAATMLEHPVSVAGYSNEDIQFHLKCLSEIPEAISKHFSYQNKIITGSTRSRNNVHKLDNYMNYSRIPYPDLKDKVYQYLKDKLIIFRLTEKINNVYAEIVQIEDLDVGNRKFTLLPGPELGLQEDKHTFEERLARTKRTINLSKYPNIFTDPEIIFYEDNLYHVKLNKTQNSTNYIQDDNEEVMYIDNEKEIELFINMVEARVGDQLFVLETTNYMDLKDIISEGGKSLYDKLEQLENAEDEVNQSFSDTYEKEEKQNSVHGKGTLQYQYQYHFNKAELEFLKSLKENAIKQGLYYDELDLISFHISVKTNMMSILGGLSGTGKSKLAILYGETLGLQNNRELLMIPISPSYHEPNDILGYLNPNTGVFHESETGLVSLLLEAMEKPEKLFMVIFDEANLSQVEHWFSPFISLLELDGDKRSLTLFNENSHCINNYYKSKINIGDNIIFVGTVNFDETTKGFSDRLLDRTNVIMPSKLSFKDARKQTVDSDKGAISPYVVDKEIFRSSWVRQDVGLDFLTDKEIDLLDELHQVLHENDLQKGVSFRVALSISNFLANIPGNEDGKPIISRNLALDLQIKQRILTKLKGLESFVGPLAGNFLGTEYEKGEITKMLEGYEEEHGFNFKYSKKILESKAKELMYNGFTN